MRPDFANNRPLIWKTGTGTTPGFGRKQDEKAIGMNEISLENARVLVVDSQLHTRRLLKDALHMIGFRTIDDLGEVRNLEQAIQRSEPHLILIDMDEDRDFLCAALKDLRNDKSGTNPFVTIIALTWQPEEDAVEAVMSAGIDDIVTKPISGKILYDRVLNLIERRKDFVVTADYVGPDRRKDCRPVSENDLPTIAVPNSLRNATAPGSSQAGSAVVNRAQISEAMRMLCAQKVYRLATQMRDVTAELHQRHKGEPGSPLADAEAKRLKDMLDEILEIIGTQGLESVTQVAENTQMVLNTVLQSVTDVDPQQLDLLRLHSEAIAVTLRESDEAAGALVSALNQAAEAVNA